jgi:hypothetical protein
LFEMKWPTFEFSELTKPLESLPLGFV